LRKQPAEKRLDRLLRTGGFPEAFLNPANAARLRNDRLDFVIREDLRDFNRTSSLRSIELLVELLRERVGGVVSYSNLARDLSVSPPTVKNWVELLERLYLVFLVYPYHRGLARSIRKEPKVYLYDCGAAYESNLENLVACSLLKYCHLQTDVRGRRHRLYYFRDRDHREVDFVITDETRVKWCIEVKSSEDKPSGALTYLAKRTQAEKAIQLVRGVEREQDSRGVQIRNISGWLERISSFK